VIPLPPFPSPFSVAVMAKHPFFEAALYASTIMAMCGHMSGSQPVRCCDSFLAPTCCSISQQHLLMCALSQMYNVALGIFGFLVVHLENVRLTKTYLVLLACGFVLDITFLSLYAHDIFKVRASPMLCLRFCIELS
jgi:hypothetical protein